MSEINLTLNQRTVAGKKLAALRAKDLIPSVVYGGQKEPMLTQSAYNDTEKVLRAVGYHSPVNLTINKQKQLAIVKNVDVNPRNRKIVNVEFQAVSANEVVEATTPIIIEGFDSSAAAKLHLELLQVLEEVEVKAKPSELPKELTINGSKLADKEDKLTIADINLPKGVEFADKELDSTQVVASVYDPAAEAAAREAADAAAEEKDAADVPTTSEDKTTEE